MGGDVALIWHLGLASACLFDNAHSSTLLFFPVRCTYFGSIFERVMYVLCYGFDDGVPPPYFRCRVNWRFSVVQILLNISKVSYYSVRHMAVLRCILSSKSVLFLTSVTFLKPYMFTMASLTIC